MRDGSDLGAWLAGAWLSCAWMACACAACACAAATCACSAATCACPNADTGKHKGYGFIEFEEHEAATQAIAVSVAWETAACGSLV